MKRSHLIITASIFVINTMNAFALEIDEKLTLRFLKVSSTKKTVLINRGGEDGLVVGDHAKFFITAGVVARGVSEKVSPSRSVWSLYRIVDPEEITQDKVLNLKIATPVKITDDPSKSLKEEAIPGGTEVMTMDDDVTSSGTPEMDNIVVNDADADELKELGMDSDEASELLSGSKSSKKTVVTKTSSTKTLPKNVVVESGPSYSKNTSKTWEVWGLMYVNSLSGTSESDDGTGAGTSESLSAAGSAIAFSVVVEKYFLNFNDFLNEVSVGAFAHKKTIESGDKFKTKSDWFEYGGGINYHFYNSAADVNRLVAFGLGTFGVGNATIESKVITNGVDSGATTEGTNSFFSLGIGAKYVLSNGFGVRGILDYYSSNEEFEFESTTTGTAVTTTQTRTLSGPRIQFGLSYRF